MDCAFTPKETDICIALLLSRCTPAQILTHLKKLNSDNCLTVTTIYNFMMKFRLKQLTEDYVWALKNLKDFYSPNYLSSLIISDDDQQLQKGLTEVFPEATNLLCAFHIKRNVCANFKTGMDKDTPEELEKIKGYWDALWMSEYNRTTNRVEGEHDILKRFLKCSIGIFLKCWKDMDNAWLTRGIKIRASFEKSINIGLHKHRRSPYIKHLVYHVSRRALDFISREIKSLSKRDPGRCQHVIRKTHGFPCACEISKYYRMGKTLQLDCIDEHWKKLSLVSVHKKVVGDV
ncbi:hypothetical protein MKX03_022141 [Papaver bracteatum]|nr:hypothetical protein MKX03_022141 [Papaver bracteatum]